MDCPQSIKMLKINLLIDDWLNTLKPSTRRQYLYTINNLITKNIMPSKNAHDEMLSLKDFKDIPHHKHIDSIKQIDEWSERTKQVYAAVYISFTKYLERVTNGWFRRSWPNNSHQNPTFYMVNDKCLSKPLSKKECDLLLKKLYELSTRDALVASCLLQGAKRISEVLNLKLHQLNFEKNVIFFEKLLKGNKVKIMPVFFPAYFMQKLAEYIKISMCYRKDSEYVFITNQGKPIFRTHFGYQLKRASKLAQIRKVSPEVLRTTWINFAKKNGIQDSEILKVTGLSDSKLINRHLYTEINSNDSQVLYLI